MARIGYLVPYSWVDITCEPERDDYGYADHFEEEVRSIYVDHALKWGLADGRGAEGDRAPPVCAGVPGAVPEFRSGFGLKPRADLAHNL